MYDISDYSYMKAKSLGVEIKPSQRKNKKIDVIKDNKVIASVGDIRYKDYPTYMRENGKQFADKRKSLYKIRHKKDINVKDSNGYYAFNLLW